MGTRRSFLKRLGAGIVAASLVAGSFYKSNQAQENFDEALDKFKNRHAGTAEKYQHVHNEELIRTLKDKRNWVREKDGYQLFTARYHHQQSKDKSWKVVDKKKLYRLSFRAKLSKALGIS